MVKVLNTQAYVLKRDVEELLKKEGYLRDCIISENNKLYEEIIDFIKNGSSIILKYKKIYVNSISCIEKFKSIELSERRFLFQLYNNYRHKIIIDHREKIHNNVISNEFSKRNEIVNNELSEYHLLNPIFHFIWDIKKVPFAILIKNKIKQYKLILLISYRCKKNNLCEDILKTIFTYIFNKNYIFIYLHNKELIKKFPLSRNIKLLKDSYNNEMKNIVDNESKHMRYLSCMFKQEIDFLKTYKKVNF